MKRRVSSVRQAVERGAKVLTLHYGSDEWLERIRQDDLHLGNPACCILGQLEGGYGRGKRALGAGVDSQPALFGFDLDTSGKVHYSLLTRVWKNFINRALRNR